MRKCENEEQNSKRNSLRELAGQKKQGLQGRKLLFSPVINGKGNIHSCSTFNMKELMAR